MQLKATIVAPKGENYKVNWSSSNEYMATVNSNGLVTSYSSTGYVTISATVGDTDKSVSCLVQIVIPVENIYLTSTLTPKDYEESINLFKYYNENLENDLTLPLNKIAKFNPVG